MKMNAPANFGSFSVGEHVYIVNEGGQIEVEDLNHVPELLQLGATHTDVPASPSYDDLLRHYNEALNRIADLEQQVAALSEGEEGTLESPEGGSVPGHPAPTGLALDDMSRDDMVNWLRSRGVAVSPSLSKANAKDAIEAFLADANETE